MPYKDPERANAYRNLWKKRRRISHPGAEAKVLKAWRVAHLGRVAATKRAWRAAHREQIKAVSRTYQITHREQRRMWERAWRIAHQGQKLAWQRAYHAAHPDTSRITRAKRRARMLGTLSTFTVSQWKAIVVAYKGCCAYCGTKPKKLTQDHVIPLARGGTHTADNVVPACLPCNLRKHTGPPPISPMVRLLL